MEDFNLILLTVLTFCCFEVAQTVPLADVSLLGGQIAIKGSNVQLVCSITDYSFQLLAAWRVPSTVSGNSDVNVVQCIGTGCIQGPVWNSRYTYSRDTSGMYLNISNLNRDVDQKLWKCVIQTANLIVTAELNLIVYTSPVGVTYNNPPVTDQDLTVNPATLTCETTQCASPPPDFTWYYMDASTRVQYTDVQAQEISQSQSCVTSEFRYRSTLTLPRYTAFTENMDKTAQFVCGATHPALSDAVYTGSSVQVTFAVHVESVTLKDGSNTPGTDKNIQVEENTEKTLTVEFSPVLSRPGPTIMCYIGTTPYTVSATTLHFTFTPRNVDHGQSVYCEAYNRGGDTFKVTSNKPKLYVKVYVASVVIKDGSSILQTGEDLTVEGNTSKSLTVEYQPSYSRPAPTVICYLGTSTTSLSGSTFIFTPSNSNHGDNVYCQAANRDVPSVKVTSGMPLLYIKVGVSSVTLTNATSDGSDLVMMDGRQETLVCVISGTRPAAEVVWYFDNTQLFTVNNVINSVSTDMFTVTSTLTVTSSRSYQGQQVTCRARVQPQNFVPSVTQRINVWYAPSQPSVRISPQLPWLEGGRSGVLSCVNSETGNPVSMVTWQHSTNSVVSDSKLMFRNISADDHGKTISCQLTNGFTGNTGIRSQSVTLNIEYKPIVTITVDNYSTPVVINEGSRLSAICQVSGNPVPVGQWQGYPSGEQLTIDDIDRNQTRNFQCVATATSTTYGQLKTTSTFSTTVQYAPDISIKVTQTSVVEQNSVLLNCDPHGLPGSYTYHRFVHSWYNTELEIKNTTKDFTIPSAGLENSGKYTCYVDNGIPSRNGELIQSGSVEIIVQVTPYAHLPNDGTFVGQPGSKVKVEVPFYSHPPISSMMIVKANQTISNTSGYTVYHTVGIVPVIVRGKQLDINGSNAVMEIDNVLQSDLGEYKLQLTNGINMATFIFKVIASRTPFDPVIVVVGAPNGAVISLVWSKGFNGGYDQMFVIEYQLSGADAWTEYKTVEENDMTYILPNGSYYTDITGLSAGEYSIRLYANNEKGPSGFVNMTNIIIEEDEVSTKQSLPVAAIAGGTAAGIVVILVVAVVVFLVRRNSSNDDRLTKQMEMERRSSDIEVINVNDQYVSAGTVNVHQNQGLASSNDEYATVNKPKKQQPPVSETYAVVDKTRFKKKGGEKESSDTQQQAENIYENPGGSVPSQSASPKPRKNQDGLIYIEVDFSKDKKKGDKKPVIIHGLDDQTTYAEVAIGKRGTPLPESDEEDHASSSK